LKKSNPTFDSVSPVTRSHAEARANYDALSRWYDTLEGGWERRPRARAIQNLTVPPNARVLEIGCGTGASLADLAEKARMGGQIFGVDLSAGMLRVAKNHMRKRKISSPVFLSQADASTLPFSSAFFQALFMSFTLELFDTPEIPLILSECRRVLQPGAVLGLVATSRMGGIGGMTSLYEFFHRKFPHTVDCHPIYAARALEAAGFKIINEEVDSLWGIGLEIITAQKY
jgi:demethylmenaquinone methyltransferase/2-methoxy-6-polyprenyl-1,4-benzoquinol methylase